MPGISELIRRARSVPVHRTRLHRGLHRAAAAWLVSVVLVAGCASQSAVPTPSIASGSPTSPGTTTPVRPTSSGLSSASPTPRPSRTAPSPTEVGGSPAPTTTPVALDPRVQAALASLTTDEALAGQLLLLGWHGTTPNSVIPTLSTLQPAGIVYIGANASTAAEAGAINAVIQATATHLGLLRPFIAIDQEGGRIQRISDVPNLGSNMAFGDTNPTDQAACERGAAQASELTGMGFNMNLAPVVDVLTNPKNTVIGDRSYGSDPQLVARLGAAYTQGLQGSGVAGVAKHFPGHGSTSVDSHLGLPVVPYGLPRLERVELVPFEREIQPDVSVAAVMVGHLSLPKLDPSGTPASLSGPIVQGLLRDQLGFQGLVMTDDLGMMAAITANYTPAQAALMAISAGVDLLIISGDVAHQVAYRDSIVAGLASGELSRERVLDAVTHVLQVKARFGLLGGAGAPAITC